MVYVIHQPWGGLGDNLQFSTLPEKLSKRGHFVYLARNNVYRNSEIYQLVWGCNPHIRGLSDIEPNCGWRGSYPNLDANVVRNWEIHYGVEPGNGLPKVYYKPLKNPDLAHIVLVDLHSITDQYASDTVYNVVLSILEREFPDAAVRWVKFVSNVAPSAVHELPPAPLEKVPIHVWSLFQYCDLIASCRALVTLWSGAHTLSAALGCADKTYSIKLARHVSGFIYDGVKYFDV